MRTSIEQTHLRDVLIVHQEVAEDERGFFREVFRADEFAQLGLPTAFVQLNHSRSRSGILRGLHFQWDPPMGKLMRVTRGRAFLVAVDVRKGSPTLGGWLGLELAGGDRRQIWAPAGIARGFCVLSDEVDIEYLCTGTYNPRCESGVRWDDPAIGVEWPLRDPILSPKDRVAQTLSQWLEREEANHFVFSEEAVR